MLMLLQLLEVNKLFLPTTVMMTRRKTNNKEIQGARFAAMLRKYMKIAARNSELPLIHTIGNFN